MKVASFNVNSLRARLDVVVDWVLESKVDVLAVQETKVQDADFPTDAFDKIGYKYVFSGQKSYNGVAIFSKSRAKNVRAGFDGEPRDEARLITAEINGVAVVNTYVPQGYMPESEKFDYKLNWFDRLVDLFEKKFNPADRVVWVGDLNVAPLAIDVYDPVTLLGHVCYHPRAHEALKRATDWGFVDVFRMHRKEAGQYTYWDYRMSNSLSVNS